MHWGKVYDASPAVHTRTHLENNRSWQMMTTYRVDQSQKDFFKQKEAIGTDEKFVKFKVVKGVL